jgi:hypothetical protein
MLSSSMSTVAATFGNALLSDIVVSWVVNGTTNFIEAIGFNFAAAAAAAGATCTAFVTTVTGAVFPRRCSVLLATAFSFADSVSLGLWFSACGGVFSPSKPKWFDWTW